MFKTPGAMLNSFERSKKRLFDAAQMLNDDRQNNASQCSLNAVIARTPPNARFNAVTKPLVKLNRRASSCAPPCKIMSRSDRKFTETGSVFVDEIRAHLLSDVLVVTSACKISICSEEDLQVEAYPRPSSFSLRGVKGAL